MNPDRDSKPRDEKKSETIEVRVPWSLKQRLTGQARREGRPASEIVRDSIEVYLRRPVLIPATQALETAMTTVRKHPRPAFAAILGAAGVSALLAGAIPAGAAPELRAAFERLDDDGDGVVTKQEYTGGIRVRQVGIQGDPPPGALDPAPEPLGYIVLPTDTPNRSKPGNARMLIPVPAPEGAAVPAPAPRPAPPQRTPEEIVAGQFTAMDSDADRSLSFEEFTAPSEALFNRSFALMDTDEDGAVGPAEAAALETVNAAIGPRLEAMDADGDGRVTHAEYIDAMRQP